MVYGKNTREICHYFASLYNVIIILICLFANTAYALTCETENYISTILIDNIVTQHVNFHSIAFNISNTIRMLRDYTSNFQLYFLTSDSENIL